MEFDVAALRQMTERVLHDRYPGAVAAFWAGSLTRPGQGTSQSDIDLVVLFDQIRTAWRETFGAEGRTVEACRASTLMSGTVSQVGRFWLLRWLGQVVTSSLMLSARLSASCSPWRSLRLSATAVAAASSLGVARSAAARRL